MELIAGLIGSIFSGGATGLIGVAIQRFADFKNKQLDMALERQRGEIEIEKRHADLAIMAKEYEGKVQVAQVEGATAKDVADTQAFAQSLFKEPERYSNSNNVSPRQQWVLVLLDALRGAVRPLLTLYLCALTTYIWYQVKTKLETEDLDAAAALEVWKYVVQNILYLTTTVVLWWFGTRNKQGPPRLG